MSNEMSEKKKAEIAAIEAEEAQIMKEMANDKCPLCGRFTRDFEYVVMLPPPMGWMECPSCGTVFCPESIRFRKLHSGGTSKVDLIAKA